MSEAAERTVKSTQEQAVASWIMFLNQRRLEILIRVRAVPSSRLFGVMKFSFAESGYSSIGYGKRI